MTYLQRMLIEVDNPLDITGGEKDSEAKTFSGLRV